MRVVTEAVPGVRSACFGIWADVGSRDETPALAGASHYLEHLLFKGTARRDALEIAAAIDRVGGEANAFTGKEQTCYYAHVLGEDLPLAVDVVADMVRGSLVRAKDVEAERTVILEEIAMHDDEPADAVHDAFAAAVFGDAPLGRPVIGTTASIEAMSRTAINGYYRRRYSAPRLVVTAAGAVDHATVVRLVRKAFRGFSDEEGAPAASRSGAARSLVAPASPVLAWDRPTEQANVILGGAGLARRDPRRFAVAVLNAALGGGMSSRLFQEVREKRGLAYSVYSFSSAYADAGLFGVYAGCAPKRVREVLAVTRDVLADVAEHGLTDEELARGKGQTRGGLVLGSEDMSTRMSRLGKGELSYDEQLTMDQVLDRIAAVGQDEVRAVAAELLRPQRWHAAGVGRFKDDAALRRATAA
jgi:predicted Zn-dependent peptidase